MIQVENVTKYYLGRKVLDDVSFTIDEGKNLGLIGPGGAGKTLVMKIICGLVDPDGGRVLIDGIDPHELSPTELADLRFRIGMLFQNYALFDFMNITDNIAFPLRQEGELGEDEIAERVTAMLATIGLPGIGHQFANELSGGMKKRVSFARAVIRQPPIIFYDDPTAGLDPVTSSKIFTLLADIRDTLGTTSLTISHDIEGIKPICDTFVLLDKGRVVFDGSREAIESDSTPIVRKFWDGFSDDVLGHVDDGHSPERSA